jgi:hypothetical protein
MDRIGTSALASAARSDASTSARDPSGSVSLFSSAIFIALSWSRSASVSNRLMLPPGVSHVKPDWGCATRPHPVVQVFDYAREVLVSSGRGSAAGAQRPDARPPKAPAARLPVVLRLSVSFKTQVNGSQILGLRRRAMLLRPTPGPCRM